jgi:hypothetical protein
MLFLSKDDLKLAYGVDLDIAGYFVNRPVPSGNYYWNKNLIYIPFAPGYYFIPIFTDMAYRIGIPKRDMLNDRYVGHAEAILHSAARLEKKELDWMGHVEECLHLTEPLAVNRGFLEDLRFYFHGDPGKASVELGTPYPSLGRADTYLFSLCLLTFGQAEKEKLVESWYALMTYFLILDDLEDIREDLKTREENSLIEAGLSEQGAGIIAGMIDRSYEVLNRINPVMANRIDHKRTTLDIAGIIRKFLSEQ